VHAARIGEMKNAYEILCGKSKERYNRRKEDNIKMELK
jgi:hypothetical protein